jgi:hypothetical protein
MPSWGQDRLTNPYVDGGFVSPTNADALVSDQPGKDNLGGNLVVVISPMSGQHNTSSLGKLTSLHARRCLSSEVRRLRADRSVLVIEPVNELSTMVTDALNGDSAQPVLAATFVRSTAHV